MTPKEFQAAYPQVIAWIQKTIAPHRSGAKRVSELGFPRLPLYVSTEFLESVSAVIVDRVPVPPLSKIGLRRFAEIEMVDHDGITYLDTYSIKQTRASDEALHFHELVHVVQWRGLGLWMVVRIRAKMKDLPRDAGLLAAFGARASAAAFPHLPGPRARSSGRTERRALLERLRESSRRHPSSRRFDEKLRRYGGEIFRIEERTITAWPRPLRAACAASGAVG